MHTIAHILDKDKDGEIDLEEALIAIKVGIFNGCSIKVNECKFICVLVVIYYINHNLNLPKTWNYNFNILQALDSEDVSVTGRQLHELICLVKSDYEADEKKE